MPKQFTSYSKTYCAKHIMTLLLSYTDCALSNNYCIDCALACIKCALANRVTNK